ncbi:MAG: (deoxy)nucleoside triphosphate pyrophosphohydrolase [Alphaproteobacteria bacterium]
MLIVVAAALLNDQRKVLLTQRPLHKHMGGLWEFPGGKVEAGEHPEMALQRELQEELGIHTNIGDFSPAGFVVWPGQDNKPFLLLLYGCEQWQGTPTPQENQNMAWYDVQYLPLEHMPPADQPLVTQWLRHV